MSERLEIKLEDVGEDDEIEVVAILVENSAVVSEGDVILEVATEKANTELEAPGSGRVEILVAEGDVVPASTVLAVVTR